MEPLKICLPTLLVAAATLSVVPEVNADTYEANDAYPVLPDSNNDTFAGDEIVVDAGTITSKSDWGEWGTYGAWIDWSVGVGSDKGGSLGSSSAKTTITGTGFLGFAVSYRYYGNCITDLTNVDASGFTGQLCVVNLYTKNVTVKLSGNWSGTEYIFGDKTAEWKGITEASDATGEVPYWRGTSASADEALDTLAIQGDTTLAGITGASKGYLVSDIALADKEFITVSDGDKLTITGSGTYEFYGTLGEQYARARLVMSGSGSQTFGGTNYLYDVTVTAGTLVLGGTTTIHDGVKISGGTLSIADGTTTISGTVDVSSAIQNSGEIILDAGNITFVLDNLTMADGNIYTIIEGSGTVSVLDGGELSTSNFTLNGVEISGRSQIIIGEGGLSVIYSVGDLTWAGTLDNNVWTTSATDWQGGDGSSTTFYQGDNVTFGANTGSVSNTIVLGENIEANTVTIAGSGYTLEAGSGSKLTATEIVLDDEENGDTHTFTIASGVTVEATTLTESAGQLDLVVHGSLTVSGMTITSEDSESISGDGTLTVGTLTHSSLQGQSLTISVSEATFENIYTANHNGYGTGDSNNTDGYHTLIFGSEGSVTNATVTGRLELWGASEVSVATGSTLTVGTLTDSSGYKTSISGDGTLVVATMEFGGNSGNTVTISIANLQANKVTFGNAGSMTISSASFKANTATFTNEGAITISSENFEISEATFSGTGTITISEGSNAVIGTVGFTQGGILAITADSMLTVGNITDSSTSAQITLESGSLLNVTGAITVAPGGANSAYSQISGSGTVITGSLSVGSTVTGGACEISGVTFITGGISFGSESQSRYYLYLDNMTLGFSQDTEIVPATAGVACELILGEFASDGGYDTSASTTSTINTGKYNTDTGTFSSTDGYTVSISQVIMGNGALVKDGAGTLILSAENTFTGGLTISAGTVVAQNANALSTGDISVADGAALQLDVAISVGSIEFADGAQLVINSEILESAISPLDATTEGVLIALITADSIKFGDTLVSDVSDEDELSDLINSYISFTTEDYELSWKWDNGTLYITSINPIPEPELFSVFFGISALGMMATRRRRRKVA